jgi:hypothetical protein
MSSLPDYRLDATVRERHGKPTEKPCVKWIMPNAIEAGINFKVIADWLGHSDGGIPVAKTYGRLRSEFSAAMAEKMSFDALAETRQPPAKKISTKLATKGRGR